MNIQPLKVKTCSLNLGELHHLNDFGYFQPEFLCVDSDGAEFTAKMRLHITEPLDSLLIVDPRHFKDGGFGANSTGSTLIARKSSYTDSVQAKKILVNDVSIKSLIFHEITSEDILTALTKGYDIRIVEENYQSAQGKPLEIAFTCHNPQIRGGGNTILFRYINWLADLGVKVSVYSCGSVTPFTRVQATFHGFDTYDAMCAAIKEDIVILYSMWHIEPMLRSNSSNKKIYHLRQIFEPYHYGADYKSMIAEKPAINLLENAPLGVITISPHLEECYRQFYNQSSYLITNGIDTSIFFPGEGKNKNPKKKTIVSVGDPSHFVKGSVVLYNALLLVAQRNKGISFEWVIASGPTANVQAWQKNLPANLKITLRHGLSQNDMRALYQNADVVVNASLYEGFGLPTLEAMLCGVPVVHADNKGLDHIIEADRDCFIVPINNDRAMSDAIEKIVTDESFAKKIAHGGYEKALKYSTREQFSLFRKTFEPILNTAFLPEQVENIEKHLERTTSQSLVSIVLPSYNQAEYLKEALDSLIAQTYPHWEAIVVNDGSKDHTEQVMHEYAKRDQRIRPVSKQNGGITLALNEGVKHAKGDFFCWLSSDDLFYPEKLEQQIKAFSNLDESYALVYGSYDLLQEETKKLDVQPFQEPLQPGTEFAEGLKFDFIDGCTIMIRMDVLRKVGIFNPYYRHSQDFELWVRLASYGYRFHIVPYKLTIRRIHVSQSSTTNMIHCRYDAAWMMNYYLTHYHLLEIYRYADFENEKGIIEFLAHFVGRMTHTEANINHPLLQQKYWNWFVHGISTFDAEKQDYILQQCLALLQKFKETTSKIDFYIEACLTELDHSRKRVRFTPNYSVNNREIRTDDRTTDSFADELFNYGTDLLVNNNTPLFAQELYFHNTNKIVDTPYKLAHSVFRYLSQFPNQYQQRVLPYVELSSIPQTYREAVRLFCHLRYPSEAEYLIQSLQFDGKREKTLLKIDPIEKRIGALSKSSAQDLNDVCSRHPSATILHYWNSLIIAKSGDFEKACKEAWKTLEYGHASCDWRIVYRIAMWAYESGDQWMTQTAVEMIRGINPNILSENSQFNKITTASSHVHSFAPKMSKEISVKIKHDVPQAKIIHCSILKYDSSSYTLFIRCKGEGEKELSASVTLPFESDLDGLYIIDPATEKKYHFNANSIYQFWNKEYSIDEEIKKYYQSVLTKNTHPTVAFTIQWSSVMGGGSSIVYRYANWLSELGLTVKIYADEEPPTWVKVNAEFRVFKDPGSRYAAIQEDVIIAYNANELPLILQHCKTTGKQVYHLAQVADEHHYGFESAALLLSPKPIFNVLNTVSVGRIVVSDHLRQHFSKKFGQNVHAIINGIDLNTHKPRWERSITKDVTILTVGNPFHGVKGTADIKQALANLAHRRKDLNLKLVIACGQNVQSNFAMNTADLGFTTTLYTGLTTRQMRDLYWSADIVINGSWYEGFGLPSIEAMANGVPLIQADNKGLDGVVKNGMNCLVVPPQAPNKITDAIQLILEDEALRKKLIRNGIETAQQFSLSRQFMDFVKVFEKILLCTFNGKKVEGKIKSFLESNCVEKAKHNEMRIQPLISVLIPVYNHAVFLPEALDSLITQTYQNWEAIVVNDGSTDETVAVMERYTALDQRIRTFHKKNGGVASALNEAIRNARGEWVCWLSSDDIFEPSKLAVHAKIIANNENTKFFHTNYFLYDEKTKRKVPNDTKIDRFLPPARDVVISFLNTNYINGITVCIHRSVFSEVGYFDEKLRNGQDYDMWLRISQHYPPVFINNHTATTRVHNSSGSTEFPEAGIFDSARSAAQFLNKNTFEKIFPLFDLTSKEEILLVVEKSLLVASLEKSLINSLGYSELLLGRLQEWVSNECPREFKTDVVRLIKQYVYDANSSTVRDDIKKSFLSLNKIDEQNYHFEPIDIDKKIVEYWAICDTLKDKSSAKAIERYLEKNQKYITIPNTEHPKYIELLDKAYLMFKDKKLSESLQLAKESEYIYSKIENISDVQFEEDLFNIIGCIYIGLNNLNEAKLYFEQTLTVNDKSSIAYSGLGEVFYLAEMDQESKSMFERALQYDPNDSKAAVRLKELSANVVADDSLSLIESENQ